MAVDRTNDARVATHEYLYSCVIRALDLCITRDPNLCKTSFQHCFLILIKSIEEPETSKVSMMDGREETTDGGNGEPVELRTCKYTTPEKVGVLIGSYAVPHGQDRRWADMHEMFSFGFRFRSPTSLKDHFRGLKPAPPKTTEAVKAHMVTNYEEYFSATADVNTVLLLAVEIFDPSIAITWAEIKISFPVFKTWSPEEIKSRYLQLKEENKKFVDPRDEQDEKAASKRRKTERASLVTRLEGMW